MKAAAISCQKSCRTLDDCNRVAVDSKMTVIYSAIYCSFYNPCGVLWGLPVANLTTSFGDNNNNNNNNDNKIMWDNVC